LSPPWRLAQRTREHCRNEAGLGASTTPSHFLQSLEIQDLVSWPQGARDLGAPENNVQKDQGEEQESRDSSGQKETLEPTLENHC
jgi:hypothetical protein